MTAHRTPYGILRSLHNLFLISLFLYTVFLLAIRLTVVNKLELRVELSWCNTEKVAAVAQHQNIQQGSVLIRVLYDCYFGDCCSPCRRLTYLAAAAIACVAALTFLGLPYSRRERGLVTSALEVIFIMRCAI